MDITAWLHSLGMQQYKAAFRDNAVDAAVLPELTADDLKDLGVSLVGHRRKLLAAIAALRRDAAPDPAALASAAERRQLTVMFCDLVGSTELAARLDPEDFREVIAAYHQRVTDAVLQFDGFVAKYMGDGVLAYFGYPRAHEDDAERAVRAGLGAIETVGGRDVKSAKLRARIGIATGIVVVGDLIGEGSAQEQSVVGETPNLAARLQALAEPDTVVIAASTRRLVGDLFEYESLGELEVKGLAGPLTAWQVLRPSGLASRFEALRGSTLTPLVGRDEEIDLLLLRWAQAKAGEGQVVLVCGEPGLGKSRVTATLGERLHAEPHLRQRYFCSVYRQHSALFPVIDQIGRIAGFAPADLPLSKLAKLEALLARGSLPEEDVALLADLLSLPVAHRHPLPNLSPQRKKERTLEAVIRWLEGLAQRRPVVIIFEDAHWIDPTSLELLNLAVERIHKLPVLLIVTFRPEFEFSWSGQPHVTTLALNRLDRRDRIALVTLIADGKVLPDDVVTQIVERTDGVPLFVEELTKSVLESGLLREEDGHYVLDGPLPPLAIPTTLRDSLTARLDRLASVRYLAQIGAAFGRWFRYTLLRAVAGLPEHDLQASLSRLVASELVFQTGTPPDAIYTFKHALVQDAAYGSLLRSTRQELHERIAAALEAQFPEMMDDQPELFARHYTEAGLVEKSVLFWTKAAQRSVARSAMAEAGAQFQKGLDQLALLSDDSARQRRELELRSSLGAVLITVKGFAAPETGQAYARARELWEQLGSPSELVHIPFGQSFHHVYRGELDLARSLAEDLLRLSRQRNDAAGLVLGYLASGRALMFAGRFAPSRSDLEEMLVLHDPTVHHSLVQDAAVHPQVGSLAHLGIVLFCLGFPDQALASSTAAIAEARRLALPASLVSSLSLGAILLSFIGDDETLDCWATQLIEIATEQGFPAWRAAGTIYRGWVKTKNGDVVEGISLLRKGSTAYRATGAEGAMSHFITFLARAYGIAGQVDEGLALLDDALQLTARTGERWVEAELNRHKGKLLRQQGRFEAAEELYRTALSIAQEQEAKLWELRAVISLARLRRYQGYHTEAGELLAPVYGWFTEGFDIQDLKEAKALLDELEREA